MYFSVIIPTYNSENYIRRALESLLKQTYKKFEVIVSDDGSSDNTKKILENYREKFIKKEIFFKIIFNKHLGPGNARNKGLLESKYEWICFLDSDDEWFKDKLELVFREVLNMSSDYNCIIHNEIYVNKNKKEINFTYTNMFDDRKPIFKQLYNKNFLSPSSMCIKKKIIFENNMFDLNLPNAQDYELWLKIGNSFKIKKLEKYLTKYFFRKNNISSRPYRERVRFLIKIANKHKTSTNSYFFIKKILQLLISKEWIKELL